MSHVGIFWPKYVQAIDIFVSSNNGSMLELATQWCWRRGTLLLYLKKRRRRNQSRPRSGKAGCEWFSHCRRRSYLTHKKIWYEPRNICKAALKPFEYLDISWRQELNHCLVLIASSSILLCWTMNPKNLFDVTTKAYFSGSFWVLSLLNITSRCSRWSILWRN